MNFSPKQTPLLIRPSHPYPYPYPASCFSVRHGPLPLHSANDQFYLATSDDVSASSGEYYVSRRVYTPPPPAQDQEACQRLWKVLEDLSGFSYA